MSEDFSDALGSFYRKVRGIEPLSENSTPSAQQEVSTTGNHAAFRMFKNIQEKKGTQTPSLPKFGFTEEASTPTLTPSPAHEIKDGFKCPVCENVLRKPTPGLDLYCKCGCTYNFDAAPKLWENQNSEKK